MTAVMRSALAAVVTVHGPTATAQTVEQFYKGRQINLIIGADVAGGYDTYGRLFARFMPKFIPGNPTIVVQILPGAGGVIAANNLYNLRQGWLHHRHHPAPDPAGADARHDRHAVRRHQVPVDRQPQQRDQRLRLLAHLARQDDARRHAEGADRRRPAAGQHRAVSRDSQQHPRHQIQDRLGLRRRQRRAAGDRTRRGQGRCSWSWSSIVVQKPDWVAEKKINLLAQFTLEKHPELPHVPTVLEFVKNEEERRRSSSCSPATCSAGRS